jgi:hypothetical protein
MPSQGNVFGAMRNNPTFKRGAAGYYAPIAGQRELPSKRASLALLALCETETLGEVSNVRGFVLVALMKATRGLDVAEVLRSSSLFCEST